jgi:hypothetical protein
MSDHMALAGILRRDVLIADALRRGRNDDGGWGYYAGKASRIEPTSWAALHLSRAGKSYQDLADGAARWLASRQRVDGLLDDLTGGPPNLGFNGLAALTVRSSGPWSGEPAKELLAALGATKGVAAENTTARQDNALQGWSWIEGTFSWIEPTAWCLLALKKSPAVLPPRERSARIDEAERLLLDRVCLTGGWNYGNSNVLGQELHAYVPTTALALLALQDRREHPSVQKSFEYLVRERLAERSGMALSLASICLRVYGAPAPDVDEGLVALAERHAFFNNLHIVAMALYSLTAQDHDVEDFRL